MTPEFPIAWKRYKKTKFLVCNNGDVVDRNTGDYINGYSDKGYRRFSYWDKHAKRVIHASIHRMVAELFIFNDDDSKTDVNHKDGNKTNNHFSNLEWTTRGENASHYHNCLGGREKSSEAWAGVQAGEGNYQAKLSNDDVLDIYNLANNSCMSQSAIADKYGINQSSVSLIKDGKRWGHLTEKANSTY
jgi:hypothetical protein